MSSATSIPKDLSITDLLIEQMRGETRMKKRTPEPRKSFELVSFRDLERLNPTLAES